MRSTTGGTCYVSFNFYSNLLRYCCHFTDEETWAVTDWLARPVTQLINSGVGRWIQVVWRYTSALTCASAALSAAVWGIPVLGFLQQKASWIYVSLLLSGGCVGSWRCNLPHGNFDPVRSPSVALQVVCDVCCIVCFLHTLAYSVVPANIPTHGDPGRQQDGSNIGGRNAALGAITAASPGPLESGAGAELLGRDGSILSSCTLTPTPPVIFLSYYSRIVLIPVKIVKAFCQFLPKKICHFDWEPIESIAQFGKKIAGLWTWFLKFVM